MKNDYLLYLEFLFSFFLLMTVIIVFKKLVALPNKKKAFLSFLEVGGDMLIYFFALIFGTLIGILFMIGYASSFLIGLFILAFAGLCDGITFVLRGIRDWTLYACCFVCWHLFWKYKIGCY